MDELNELPQGWKWVRLGDVCHIFAGYSFESDDFSKTTGVKCIKITNVGVRELVETHDYLPDFFTKKYANFLVKENDLVIALTRPYIADGLKITICPASYNNSLLNQRVAVIRNVSKIDFKYLYFFMISDYVLSFYQRKFKTANLQPNLRLCDLTNLIIPFSPLPEQQRLATLLTAKLSLIEQAKEKITAQLQAAQELTAAYLREVFESEEAKGWELVKLGDICSYISDGAHFTPTYITHGVPFLSVKDVRETGINFSNCRYISEEEHKQLCKRCKPEKGDVLYTKVGTTGIAKMIDVDIEFSIFVSLALLKLNKQKIIPEFLEKILNSPMCKAQADNLTQGAGNKNLVLQDLKRIEFYIPNTEKQTQLANYLTEKLATVEQLKTTLQTQLDSINQLPAALLKQAFKGEL